MKELSEDYVKMGHPITKSEMIANIKALKVNKASGRDGLSSEIYKSFNSFLVEPLTRTCNTVLSQGIMPDSWWDERIIVIPKVGKDLQKVLIDPYYF